MTSRKKRPAPAAAPADPTGPGHAAGRARLALRRRAEATLRGTAGQSPGFPEAMSPDATRETLHELRVHQIELEMQNEELRRAQVELDVSRARYFDLYDLAPVGYCSVSEAGLILQANLTAARLLGVARGMLVTQPISRFIHKEDQDSYYLHQRRLTETGESQSFDIRTVKGDGTPFWAHLAVAAATGGSAPELRIVLSDITQQHQDVEEIHRLALYDSLTGLPNRRLLMDRLRQAAATSARTGQHGALMFLDLDNFKQLNDTLGHGVGDILLQQVSARLKARVRKCDSVARLGGDEFVVLLEALSRQSADAAKQAQAVALKIQAVLGKPYSLSGHTHTGTASIGITLFMQDHDAIDELLKKADAAMYQAKSAGRNTACFFDPAMQAAAAAQAELEKDLGRGLAEQEFVLHYQIQVDGDGASTGAEALVRWNHARRGMVAPADFIPLAEETGLILPLGQWVLETACAQLVEWSRHPRTAQWTMAVNVSASQLAHADFVASVATALERTGANPCLLKLELTESTLVDDVEALIVKMNEIKAYGVGFSLDDFGTGYSSLSRLKRLPLVQLKIDQSFVRDILSDPNDGVIARAVVALGHSLGLKVLAEGVETADQRDFLAGIGCDAFQGFYFGRPVPADSPAGMDNTNPVQG